MRRRVSVQEIPDVRLAVLGPGGPITTIERLPYFVDQERTGLYGYRIIPFDAEDAHVNREPSLEAFHIDLHRYGARIRVALVDSQGDVIDDSMRRIRVLDGSPSAGVLVVLAFLPLAVGIGVGYARLKITSASYPAHASRS